MEVLANIYYIFGLFVLFYETNWFLNTEEKTRETKEIMDDIKDANKEWEEKKPMSYWKKETKDKVFTTSIYFLWTTAGLFSTNWLPFLILFLMSFVFGALTKPHKYNEKYIKLKKIDSAISALIILFIIINKFHLHITF